jgi:hypothetical protein
MPTNDTFHDIVKKALMRDKGTCRIREFTKNNTPILPVFLLCILRCDNERIFQYSFVITP